MHWERVSESFDEVPSIDAADMIRSLPEVHRSKLCAAGLKRSPNGSAVIIMMRDPAVSASSRMAFSAGEMNGDTNTPPFSAA